MSFSISRNSPYLEIHEPWPTTEKSHLSDILHKAYTGKTVICCTLTMNTIIIVLYSYKVTLHVYVYMYRSV